MPWWKFWEAERRGDATPDYYEEGVALARDKRYHEALTSFRLALRERPENAAILEQMAVVYSQIGLTDEAVKLYHRILGLRNSPAAHYGLAFLLLRRGSRDEAAEHLRSFLDSAPAGAWADEHVNHARETLERLGREADAPRGSEREEVGEGDA